RTEADSKAATVYEFWLPEVVKQVSDLYVPPQGREVFGNLATIKVLEKLATPDAAFGPRPQEGRDALLMAALETGMRKLTEMLGTDSNKWEWGNLHHIQFEHSLAGLLPDAK